MMMMMMMMIFAHEKIFTPKGEYIYMYKSVN
jgi:hypothetical protein